MLNYEHLTYIFQHEYKMRNKNAYKNEAAAAAAAADEASDWAGDTNKWTNECDQKQLLYYLTLPAEIRVNSWLRMRNCRKKKQIQQQQQQQQHTSGNNKRL